MYRCTTYIEITTATGTVKFDYVHALTVQHSIESMTDICTLTLPRNLNLKDKNIRDIISVGDQVSVQLGYDDSNDTVFEGFIRSIKPGTPVVMTCEDTMYILKRIKVPNKHYLSVTLTEFLKEHMPPGMVMNLADVKLGELRIVDEPTLAKVLDRFIDEYTLRFFFRDGVFYGVLPSTYAALTGIETHKLRLSWNTTDDYRLNYVNADDIEVTIKAKAILKDNTKLEVQEPEGKADGDVRTYFSDTATTKDELRAFAQEKLKSYKEERVDGTVTVFGLPYIRVADRVKLFSDRDAEFNEKTFLVKEVKRTFGDGGIRQVITLGVKIS
ncbi:MAG: hypothetical protein R2764_01585 [Bacteroidales bacterium]